jgi:site-specific recombinase XerD
MAQPPSPNTELLENIPNEKILELLTNLLEKTPQLTIEELCQKHHQYIVAKDYAHETKRDYRVAYKLFNEWSSKKGLKYVGEVTYGHADEFYNYLLSTPELYRHNKVAKNTAIRRYKFVKAIFGLAIKRNHVARNPFENKNYKLKPVLEWWTDDYFHKLINAIRTHTGPSMRQRHELITRTIYTTGIRVGILHRLKHKDVRIDEEGRIHITVDLKISRSAEKTRETIQLLEKNTTEQFKAYYQEKSCQGINDDQYLFGRYGDHSYRDMLRRVCKRAGLKYLSPHKAKHGFVNKMASNGLTSVKICALTTNRTPWLIDKIYTHISFQDVKDKAREILNK